MPSCPKCGSRVREDYEFCPKCGAALKLAPTPPAPAAPAPPSAPPYRGEKYEKREKEEERAEKREKEEKGEKSEKAEKYEKYERRELSYLGPLVGGLILILLGLMSYVAIQMAVPSHIWVAFFFVIIGIIVLVAGIYAVTVATRRSPQT